jgi:malonyl-CoA O-methyltransferase
MTLSLDAFRLPCTRRPLIVEGAGGVLVPLNAEALMIDLMKHLALPIVLVARTTLGTINHTLLSLEALRARRLAVAGIVLSGPPDEANRRAIEAFGRVRVVAELPRFERLDAETLLRFALAHPPRLGEAVA